LRPEQIKRLLFLAFLLVLSLVLLFLYPSLRSSRDAALRTGRDQPSPSLENAPPPPPSPFPPGASVFHGALKEVKDFTPRQELERDPAYRVLLEHVLSLDPALLTGASEGRLAYATYLKHSAELRGRVFHLEGEAIDNVEVVRLPDPVDGREDVYRVYLFDHEDDAGYIVDFLDRPPALEKRDAIELEGVFYKVLRHQNRGNRDREYPLLIARSFRAVPPQAAAPSNQSFTAFKTVLVVGIACTLVVAWFLMRQTGRTRYPGLRRAASAGPGGRPARRDGASPPPPQPRLSEGGPQEIAPP